MTGLRLRAVLAIGGLALLACACSSSSTGNTNYSQFYQILRQSFSASFGKVRVTRQQAAAIPYASLGFSLDDGNQNILVLGTDSGGELLWTSAAHVVIVTRQGRIVRTLGLGHDLAGMTTRDERPLPAPAAALIDFPERGLYGVLVSCRAHLVGRQSVSILGQAIPVSRVDESCTARRPEWTFTDTFWVDGDSGQVWRSRQHIHPDGGTVETELFRPPG